ncbi:MAG: outer membrane protein assembly factor BamD [Candidatus Omnitrophota bacterium]|jgi:outer membrane protein assembly factor BamD|nr:MAG: outer membrane protein assembly factor BamD [Candidatus Omnitrophota bacterium]
MKKAFFFIITISVLAVFLPQDAGAYWIWTPKTGKWVNPKNQVKGTPQEQFKLAKDLYDSGQLAEADREFKKLIKRYPKAFEASESQYYLGLIEEKQGNLYEAFTAYQKVIDKYPFSERIQEIIEKEYKIGEEFMSGYKRKGLGATFAVENPAIEIFTKVVENSTYGPLAAKAQYKLGLVLKGLMRYYDAEEAFDKVINNYPDSEWVEAAKFQIAECRASLSRGPDYDLGAAKDAKDRFEDFLMEHPDAELSREAEKNIQELNEKEAESSYNIAFFYEKQRDFKPAMIYYQDIIEKYPNSIWAAKALERMRVLERKK